MSDFALKAAAAFLLAAGPFCLGAPAGEPAGTDAAAGKPVSSWDFDGKDAWSAWELDPPEPRETGRSEWEEVALEFLGPAGGRARLEVLIDGAGVLDVDAFELYRLARRGRPVSERRQINNPGFDAAEKDDPVRPVGWQLSGTAVRTAVRSFSGDASLCFSLPVQGKASASQEISLREGERYRLVFKIRGELTAGAAVARVRPPDSADAVLASEALGVSTLGGGRGRCGRLSAEKGRARFARLSMSAGAGGNRTLEALIRGSLREKGRLKLRLSGRDRGGTEVLLAARTLTAGSLGPGWQPLRMNFALRGVSSLSLAVRLEGPGAVEFDGLAVRPPRVIPAPRRMTPGETADNFRPRGSRPLFSSRGREDAEMVRVFTNLVGERMNRPTAFWQFWRSGRAFEHQARSFSQALEAKPEDGSVWLLDASRKKEAKWLAEHAVVVPDRPGAYAISVNSKALIVAARSREGFLAAGSTLSWLTADGPEPEVFAARIEDWPAHPFRAAQISFDGRLDASDRELVNRLGAYRLSHLVITGRGFWQISEPKSRSEATDLLELASGFGLRAVPFIDALGSAPALAERSPQSVEMVWQRDESHYLRGTERSFLAARNAVPCAGAPVEVTSPNGKPFKPGRDYRLEAPAPRLGADAAAAPRSWLRRAEGSGIADGGRVLLSYNALPAPREEPA
ncbi:MAG: hypothetical protein ACYTGB_16565, partial [Planctomycetota bacterium]